MHHSNSGDPDEIRPIYLYTTSFIVCADHKLLTFAMSLKHAVSKRCKGAHV